MDSRRHRAKLSFRGATLSLLIAGVSWLCLTHSFVHLKWEGSKLTNPPVYLPPPPPVVKKQIVPPSSKQKYTLKSVRDNLQTSLSEYKQASSKCQLYAQQVSNTSQYITSHYAKKPTPIMPSYPHVYKNGTMLVPNKSLTFWKLHNHTGTVTDWVKQLDGLDILHKVNGKALVNWALLTLQLRRAAVSIPTPVVDADFVNSCPPKQIVPQGYLMEQDWQMIQAGFEKNMSKIQPSPGKLWDYLSPAKRKETMRVVDEMWQDWLTAQEVARLQEYKASLATQGPLKAECVSANIMSKAKRSTLEVVSMLVSVGLDAQRAHKDVRKAMLDLLKKEGLSTDKIILDADLSTTSSRRLTPQRSSTLASSSWRWYTDSPAWSLLPPVVEYALESVGGYHDEVDQYIDKLPHNWTESVVKDWRTRLGSTAVPAWVQKLRRPI
jgi:hypothetical protein